MGKESAKLRELILQLFKSHPSLSVPFILEAYGESSQALTRSVQRTLKDMILSDGVVPEGRARRRVYTLGVATTTIVSKHTSDKVFGHFENIQLTQLSLNALKDVTQPLEQRPKVGYSQDFLRNYQPNVSFYLSKNERELLKGVGIVQAEALPAGTYAKRILQRFIAELSWNSSRLEGNTYSLLDTTNLIEMGLRNEKSSGTDAQMILNHKNAIEFIVDSSLDSNLSFGQICQIHALLSENLLGNPAAEGQIRTIPVGIGGSGYTPLANPHLVKELLQVFVTKFNEIENPFERSFFGLIQLSYLQAFEDVNKRTSRIIANTPFIQENLKPLSFDGVKQSDYFLSLLAVYEYENISLFKDLFVWAYQASAERYSSVQKTIGEPSVVYQQNREAIKTIVRQIILNKTSLEKSPAIIKEEVAKLSLGDDQKSELLHIVEDQIISLHENNVAKFRVSPQQFRDWLSAR